MYSKSMRLGSGLLLVGLFLMLFSSFVFGSHYIRRSHVALQDSGGTAPSGDSGSYTAPSGDTGTYTGGTAPTGDTGSYTGGTSAPPGGVVSGPAPTDSGTTGGTAPTSGTVYSDTGTHTDASGNTVTTQTYSYVDAGGQTVTGGGLQSYTATDPTTGQAITTQTFTYTDPNTGQTFQSAQNYVVTADPSLGTGGQVYEYYHPAFEGQQIQDFATYQNPEGQQVYQSGFFDPATGQQVFESRYTALEVPEGATPQYEYRFFDPVSGQEQVHTSTYTVQGGVYQTQVFTEEGRTLNYEVNPVEFGGVYDSSRGVYTGAAMGGTTWSWNPAVNEYIVITADGAVRSGIEAGPGGWSEDGQIVITESGIAYNVNVENTRQTIQNNFADRFTSIHGFTPPPEELRVFEQYAEAQAQRHAAGESAYAGLAGAGIEVGRLESLLLGPPIEVGGLGAPPPQFIGPHQYREQLETALGVPYDSLTSNQRASFWARNEELNDELRGFVLPDPNPESYVEMQEYFKNFNVPPAHRFIKDEGQFETMLNIKAEFYEKFATALEQQGEGNKDLIESELRQEAKARWVEEFGSFPTVLTEPPEPELNFCDSAECAPTVLTSVEELDRQEEFEAKFDDLKALGIPENHPQWLALENQLKAEMDKLHEDQQQYLVIALATGCGGEFGGGADACAEKVDMVKEAYSGCGASGSSSECYDMVVELAAEFPCSGVSDSDSCSGSFDKALADVELLEDPAAKEAYLHSVDILSEKWEGIEIIEQISACEAGGGDCAAVAKETFEEVLEEDKALFDANMETMEIKDVVRTETAENAERAEFNAQVDPAVTAALDAANAPEALQTSIETRLNTQEEQRIDLMEQVVDLLIDQGATVEEIQDGIYYMNKYEEYIDGCQDAFAEGNFHDGVGSLEAAELAFDEYMEWARVMAVQ